MLKFFKMLIWAEHLSQKDFQMWLLKYAIFGADFESVEIWLKSYPKNVVVQLFIRTVHRKKNYIFQLSVEKCPYIRRIMLSVRGIFLLTPTTLFPYKIGREIMACYITETIRRTVTAYKYIPDMELFC